MIKYYSSPLAVAVVCCILVLTMVQSSARAQAWPCSCGASQPGTTGPQGTDFLLVYMQNEDGDYQKNAPTTYRDLYIASVSTKPAKVEVTCKAYPTIMAPFTIPAGTSMVIPLVTVFGNLSTEMVGSTGIDPTVIRVISDEPIICYGMNHKEATADAFIAIPKSASGTKYAIMSYPNSSLNIAAPHSSEFAVAAFSNKTTVTIKPACPVVVSGVAKAAGVPIVFVLDSGDGVQIQTDESLSDLDLTGSTVESDKAIAVYGGHVRTEVEHNFTYFDDQGRVTTSRDHLIEAMPPVSAWDSKFIVANFEPRIARGTGDEIRVMTSPFGHVDGDIYINGVKWATLKPGEFKDYTIALDRSVRANNVISIEAKPVAGHANDKIYLLVGEYAHTNDGVSDIGDPFFAIVPPISQSYNDFPYFISTDPTYDSNYVMIITENTSIGSIAISNAGGTFTPPASEYLPAPAFSSGASNYSVACLKQPSGLYSIKTPNPKEKGFLVLVYGFGFVDSYGYTAGSLFIPNTIVAKNAHQRTIVGPSYPAYSIENVLQTQVLLDSIRIEYSSNPDNVAVVASIPMTYPGSLEMGEGKYVAFSPERTPLEPIKGTAVVYYHSGNWRNMYPLRLPFEIAAGTPSSVNRPADLLAITVNPNPSSNGVTTLRCMLPQDATATLSVSDALGREIPVSFDGRLQEGENIIPVVTRSLAPGVYFYQLTIPQLKVSAKGQFIVQ